MTLGCGYHVRANGEPVGIGIPSLAIPTMTSTSSNLGFEGEFTRVVREEFVTHARVPLVPREEAAAVILGHIYEIKTEPLTYSLTQTPVKNKVVTYEVTNSRRLIIRLSAKMVDRTTGKVVWEDKAMTEKSSFQVGTDPLANRYNERRALEDVALRLARRIYQKTMERF